jgi:CheY-like chemotaxis protein
MTILLVEDNVADATLTREALTEAGVRHELFVVPDGEEATRFLNKASGYEDAPRPSVILLDLNLPKKHGFEVLAEIKADPVLRRIPVVVISNSRSREDINEVYQLRGNSYLGKSADLEEFFATVKSMAGFWMEKAELPSIS